MANRNQSLLIGIAGGSASGKTTFAAALNVALTERGLTVETIGMDRYFYREKPGGPRFISPTTGEEMPDNNHPNSADNARLIADLQSQRTADDAPNVLLIEGLMTLHLPELRDILDLRLFIELDADVRALRRLLRDMNGGRGSTDPHIISAYYRECARLGHASYVEPSRIHADLILRGDADFSRTVPMVADLIAARIAKENAAKENSAG